MRIAIVGGGISGLAAAYELTTRGIPFVLFERAATCGGVIVTDRVDGYTIDAGPDALLTQKPAAVALCRQLGLECRLQPQRARATFLVRGGELVSLPEASVVGIPTRWMPFVTTRAFSWHGKLRMAAEALLPRRATDEDESIASFIGRRFGAEAVAYLAEPFLAGIHGGDPAQLSMRAAFPHLLELETKHGGIIRGLRTTRPGAASGGSSPFVALADGMGELTGAMLKALAPGSIRGGVGIRSVANTAGAWTLTTDRGECVAADSVILATPPPATSRLLASLDAPASSLAAQIPMTSAVTIAFGYSRSNINHPLDGTGFVVPKREGLSIRAASWVSSKWSHRAPADRVLLRAYVGGASDPGAVDRSDEALANLAQRDLSKLLQIVGDPELVRVYRWRSTTPQMTVGHFERMAEIDRRLALHPGLAVTASGFRGTGIADCVADARRVAWEVAQDFLRASAMSSRTLSAAG
jgi:oxygen-dependent protoporphyrinogen oxidase